jgi:hypothetical protein
MSRDITFGMWLQYKAPNTAPASLLRTRGVQLKVRAPAGGPPDSCTDYARIMPPVVGRNNGRDKRLRSPEMKRDTSLPLAVEIVP